MPFSACSLESGEKMNLYDTPAPLIAGAFFVLMLVAVEFGHRLGRRLDAGVWDKSNGAYSTLTGAVLGLLGLLLAFSFSMADARYSARKAIVLKEANAIGTAYLRTSFLEASNETRMKALMREYVDARLDYQDPQKEVQALAHAQRLQEQMWALVASGEAYREPKAVSLSLLASSLNDVIDVSGERKAARDNRVPDAVLWLLFVVAVLSGTLGGFAFGATRHRNLTVTIAFTVLVTMVVFTILDLDRPRRGVIQVDQTPMLDLQASLRT
jgi:hypothetical protein